MHPHDKTVQFRGLEYSVPRHVEEEVARVLAPYSGTATVIAQPVEAPVETKEPVKEPAKEVETSKPKGQKKKKW